MRELVGAGLLGGDALEPGNYEAAVGGVVVVRVWEKIGARMCSTLLML